MKTSDLGELKQDYSDWSITRSLDATFGELVSREVANRALPVMSGA